MTYSRNAIGIHCNQHHSGGMQTGQYGLPRSSSAPKKNGVKKPRTKSLPGVTGYAAVEATTFHMARTCKIRMVSLELNVP